MELPANPSALVDLLRAWFFAKDRSLVMADNCFIEGDEISIPGNPISGRRRLYAKSDCWYDLDSSGVETSLCGSSTEYAIVVDQKAAGVNGGTFTSGAWRTRDLNTIYLNTMGLSLLANQITLLAGNYYLVASAPGIHVSNHQAVWYNVTDGTNVLYGSNCYDGGIDTETRSFIAGYFTIASSKVFELRNKCAVTSINIGFGLAGQNAIPAIFSIVEIMKL